MIGLKKRTFDNDDNWEYIKMVDGIPYIYRKIDGEFVFIGKVTEFKGKWFQGGR